jgi:hypothetical protein
MVALYIYVRGKIRKEEVSFTQEVISSDVNQSLSLPAESKTNCQRKLPSVIKRKMTSMATTGQKVEKLITHLAAKAYRGLIHKVTCKVASCLLTLVWYVTFTPLPRSGD